MHHIQVMLEPKGYRFPEEESLKKLYDDALMQWDTKSKKILLKIIKKKNLYYINIAKAF